MKTFTRIILIIVVILLLTAVVFTIYYYIGEVPKSTDEETKAAFMNDNRAKIIVAFIARYRHSHGRFPSYSIYHKNVPDADSAEYADIKKIYVLKGYVTLDDLKNVL